LFVAREAGTIVPMSVFERDDARIHYEVRGEGFPVLLFAPGGMRSSISVWQRSPFDPIEILSPSFRVIAMDQRNAGESTAPVRDGDGS
jgi:pimeloyl-ACP methyl ester carboxylesterase